MSDPGQKLTAFQLAWKHYVEEELPKKKSKKKFVVRCLTDPISPTPESINDTIKEVEQKHSDTISRKWISRYLSPIVITLKDYNDIINTCLSGDPMPGAIIWGSLKILLNGLDRFQSLFETIGQTLTKLRTQIRRINAYDSLYGEDADMQTLLYQTYVGVIRFWVQVDKECDRCVYNTLFRATVPFSTNKLNTIVNDIKESVDTIEKQAMIVEGLFQREDRKDAVIEREAQAKERRDAGKERERQDKFREEQREKLHFDRLSNVSNWLGSAEAISQTYERHQRNLRLHMEGTSQWLVEDPKFAMWLNGTSSSSILWIHSPPGAGKSILCSHVIKLIQESKDPIAFYFYDFARDCKAIEAMRLLAHQLLRHHSIDPESKTLEDLCKIARLEPCCQDNIQDMLKILVEGLPKVHFVLDGLDESDESILVLDFLLKLASSRPDTLYLWCSSQDRPPIRERLHTFPTLEIGNCVEQDIISYLTSCLGQSGKVATSVSRADQVTDLAKRSQCNFLWASLMIRHIKEIANSPADVQEVIDSGLPDNLYGYYRRIFERISTAHRPICSKIFSLVAFAKRPLRLEELREAIGILQSKSPAVLTVDDLPYTNTLLGHLSPLIEVIEMKGSEHPDRFCRLFHSTVRNFLAENPAVFSPRTDNEPVHDLDITPYTAANACLLYLSQSRYETLLVRDELGAWRDNLGNAVNAQNLLLYAAKYWDRHLDELPHNDNLHDRVVSFIRSSNFRTCIQVQSLWVDSQFSVFRALAHDNRFQFLRRVFPRWLVETTVGRRLWCEYRQFLHEWKYFLNCGDCGNRGDSDCSTLPCIGDINRCWWTALGPHNFLSGLTGRYHSFIFEESDTSETKPVLIFDGVSQLGDTVVILKFQSHLVSEQETLDIVCESWSVKGRSAPARHRRQTIQVTQSVAGLSPYIKSVARDAVRIGMALPAAVDRDCQTLRIGVQIFTRDEKGDFIPLPSALGPEKRKYAPYIEEFSRRGNIVAVATRTRVTSKSYLEQEIAKESIKPNRVPWESDEEECVSSSEAEEDEDEEAYESWSDGSTIYSGSDNLPYDDDEAGPWDDRISDQESESEQEDDRSIKSVTSEGSDKSSSDDSAVDSEAILGYGRLRDEEDYDWSSESGDESDGFIMRRAKKSKTKKQDGVDDSIKRTTEYETRASIRIFDTRSSIPTLLFHLARPLAFKLYDSPPVFHPTASLVVWPLNGGDILFADFNNNSYFVRRLRPSTYHTRHIFMKCHFSMCGRFLHIAGLEAQATAASKKLDSRQDNSAILPLKLAFLVSSYRLSAKKTASSPPNLVHRVRIDLGSISLLSVTKLPYTLSWTPEELYFTISDCMLRVYRIRLFKHQSETKGEQETQVMTPRKSIFLPETAQTRPVYYFPARADNDACIIIGGETREAAELTETMQFVLQTKGKEKKSKPTENVVGVRGDCAAPVGCYINAQDLGGWRNPSDRSEIPQYMGVGCLSRRLEKFNPDDDCDLEPYIF